MTGAWDYQPYITPYEYAIFYNAVSGLQEYFYIPVAVATQIVNGTNYRFLTVAEPRDKNLSPHFAMVYIFQPIAGQPYVENIIPL